MNDQSIPWQSLFEIILKEEDKEKLAKRVDELEAAMFFRLEELGKRSDAAEERAELKEATKALFRIKVEKLGYPVSGLRSFRGGQA